MYDDFESYKSLRRQERQRVYGATYAGRTAIAVVASVAVLAGAQDGRFVLLMPPPHTSLGSWSIPPFAKSALQAWLDDNMDIDAKYMVSRTGPWQDARRNITPEAPAAPKVTDPKIPKNNDDTAGCGCDAPIRVARVVKRKAAPENVAYLIPPDSSDPQDQNGSSVQFQNSGSLNGGGVGSSDLSANAGAIPDSGITNSGYDPYQGDQYPYPTSINIHRRIRPIFTPEFNPMSRRVNHNPGLGFPRPMIVSSFHHF